MTKCLDASLVLQQVLQEPGSDLVEEWLERHAEEELVAPHFFPAEVLSTLRRACRQSKMTLQQARQAIRLVIGLNLRLIWDWELAERAFALAEELDQPTVYDTLYLAVAEAEGCELWTVDEQFAKSARPRYPFVHLLGEQDTG